MRSYKCLILIGLLGSLVLSGAGQESVPVLKVNCPDRYGCFRLLGQAIETAPEGAIIQLSPGVYYELPLLISKSLTIRGARSASTTIKAVDSGALITIRASNQPITVNLESLILHNPVLDLIVTPSGRGDAINLQIEGLSEGNPEDIKVLLEDSYILSAGIGISVEGRAQLTLQGNGIEARLAALIAENGGQLMVNENSFVIERPKEAFSIILLSEVEAQFQKNWIFQRVINPEEARVIGVMISGGQYSFVENQFSTLAVGAALASKTTADFHRNLFREDKIGISLHIPPCIPNPAPELRFEGFITGADNQFSYNKVDLCPGLGEFPWPPGFMKP